MSTIRSLALSLLVACASFDPSSAVGAQLDFDLRIEHGRVPESMRVIRVSEGDVVTLRWSVDQPVTLHLHGYDIEKRVEPGTVGAMSFTARATGRFPIEVHGAATGTGGRAGGEEPLAYVEVYPR